MHKTRQGSLLLSPFSAMLPSLEDSLCFLPLSCYFVDALFLGICIQKNKVHQHSLRFDF